MEHLPACLTRPESDALIDRIEAHFEAHGFGIFAAELRATGELAGFIGLAIPQFERTSRHAWRSAGGCGQPAVAACEGEAGNDLRRGV
jgi:hypothetical protein